MFAVYTRLFSFALLRTWARGSSATTSALALRLDEARNMAKARRGGGSSKGMAHSVKKMMRRFSTTTHLVKGTKRQAKQPVHPGAKVVSKNAKWKKALAEGEPIKVGPHGKLIGGTEKRAEARKALGKQARLEETARRRGMGIIPDKAASAIANEMGDADDADAESEVAASAAAKRALATAPPNQRTFHKELSIVLKAADVLLEVLDARDPMGCRCLALEDAVLAKCRGKRVVLVLNKVDLVPPEVTQRWLAYLRQYFPTIPFKASTQSNKGTVSSSKQSDSVGKLGSYGGEAYGGDALLQLLKNYSRSLGMKTAITVGIVGYPNVGKSSLINSLKRARAVNVGATPGVTTVAQTIALDSKVKLMDCPGIIFARAHTPEEQADVMLRNCMRVEQIDDPSMPIEAILRKVPATQLMKQYDVASFGGALEFCTLVAGKRGMLRKGGAADQDAAARVILHEWNAGLIKYHTEPPKNAGKVQVVQHFSEEFDWDAQAKVVDADAKVDGGGVEAALAERSAAAAGGGDVAGASAGGDEDGEGAGEMDEEGGEGDEATGGGAGGARRLLQGWTQAHDRDATKKKKEKRAPTKRAISICSVDEDLRYNFQHNKGIKKAQKEKQKKARRNAAASMMLG